MLTTFKILRYNPEVDKKIYYKTYSLDASENRSILDCLNEIKWHIDGSLTFRRSCGHGMCGSCAMNINGINRLACQTLIKDTGYKVQIEPLKSFPIIRDLVVDLTCFFESYQQIIPYLINNSSVNDKERLQSSEEQNLIEEAASCILCASCTSSCPSFWADNNYLGPSALLKAYRFIFDSRDEAKSERLKIINSRQGIWKCHTIFNCMEACPKEINITESISRLKLKLLSIL